VQRQILTITSNLYSGNVQLEFNPNNHTYYVVDNGERVRVPSVTRVCGVLDKSGPLMAWALNKALAVCKGGIQPDTPYPDIYLEEVWKTAKRAHRVLKEEAGDVGHEAHKIIEAHLKGESVSTTDQSLGRECADRAIQWMGEHAFRPLAIERYVYSRKYGCSGMLDCLAYVDDELAIVDWKSSKSIYPEYFFQTAAYQGFYQEETGDKVQCRYLVRLGKEDGILEVRKRSGLVNFRNDYKGFLGLLQAMNSLKEVERGMNE